MQLCKMNHFSRIRGNLNFECASLAPLKRGEKSRFWCRNHKMNQSTRNMQHTLYRYIHNVNVPSSQVNWTPSYLLPSERFTKTQAAIKRTLRSPWCWHCAMPYDLVISMEVRFTRPPKQSDCINERMMFVIYRSSHQVRVDVSVY